MPLLLGVGDHRILRVENLHQGEQAIKMYLMVFFSQIPLLEEPQIDQDHYKNFSFDLYSPLSFLYQHRPYWLFYILLILINSNHLLKKSPYEHIPLKISSVNSDNPRENLLSEDEQVPAVMLIICKQLIDRNNRLIVNLKSSFAEIFHKFSFWAIVICCWVLLESSSVEVVKSSVLRFPRETATGTWVNSSIIEFIWRTIIQK